VLTSKTILISFSKSFLQLWAEFKTDPILLNWAKKTSLLPSLSNEDKSAAGETIFQKLVTFYQDIVTRSQDMIVHLVSTEVESGLRAHHVVMSHK
jgi:hypothetical protein